MENLPKVSVKPAQIKGIFPLLALFLLVIEGILGYWLFRSETTSERIIAGLIIVVIASVFLYSAIVITSETEQTKRISPKGLPEIHPGENIATEGEIKSKENQKLGAGDGSFLIDNPPEHWIVEEMPISKWAKQATVFYDNPPPETAIDPDEVKILSIQSPKNFLLTPIPGKTILSGRKIPTALKSRLLIRLGIIAIDRAQPPFFIERPLEHNLLTFLSGFLLGGGAALTTLSSFNSDILPKTKLRYISTEAIQQLENIYSNGEILANLSIHTFFMGIEGDVRDYILIMNYPSISNLDKSVSDEIETLQNIISSFRPLKVVNAKKIENEKRVEYDQKFNEMLDIGKAQFFLNEFKVVFNGLKKWDLSEPQARMRSIELLKPYKLLAEELKYENEFLGKIWISMKEAEEGNAMNYIGLVNEVLIEFNLKEAEKPRIQEINEGEISESPPE